jgi:uncharacterized membrane protein YecN with MAPEG domain
MATGLMITVAGLGITAAVQPLGSLSGTLVGRFHLLALCTLAPTVALTVSIARLAAHRFVTPQDIGGSGLTGGTERAHMLQALPQNTLEQLALAVPVYTAWAMFAPAYLLAAVLVAALMFISGRALFFWGYARGAPGRALGFTLTFCPTVLLLVGDMFFAGSVIRH